MMVEVKVPTVGESITQGLLVRWFKKSGETVQVDEPIFELETDKVTVSATAEKAGRLEVRVPEGTTVEIGQVVGAIDTEAKQAAAPAKVPTPGPPSPPGSRGDEGAGAEGARPAPAMLESLSPSVRRLVEENRLDPASIQGTGPRGRLLKEDVLRHLEGAAANAPTQAPAPVPAAAAPKAAAAPAPAPAPAAVPSGRQTRAKLTPIRARIAERLIQAQNTAAILTTFNEVDMTRLIELRARHKEELQRQHGISLGYVSFFAKAVVGALRAVPAVNAWIEGDELVQNHYYDIGVAVSTPRGLVVPVIRDCDQLTIVQIEQRLSDIAKRAQTGALQLSELQGGVFTISNGGVFGSLLSTPILNPPQSGVLGMHAIKKRPVAMGDQVVIRPMMYLALSYDHRVVDGAEAVTFLKQVCSCIEDPEKLLLEVCGGKP